MSRLSRIDPLYTRTAVERVPLRCGYRLRTTSVAGGRQLLRTDDQAFNAFREAKAMGTPIRNMCTAIVSARQSGSLEPGDAAESGTTM